MNKRQLGKALASRLTYRGRITNAQEGEQIVEALAEVLREELVRGGSVTISNLFSLRTACRPGPWPIGVTDRADRLYISFRAAPKLLARVRDRDDRVTIPDDPEASSGAA